jgi:RND family efflux transporter MFP subunit
MASTVDLRELAIDRGDSGRAHLRTRRHLLTRYVLPILLASGFLALAFWASWDMVFPPKQVTVIPVFSTTAEIRREGTPLFKAAGWIEPRPTPVRVAALAPGVVEALLVVEDQPVKAGDAIAELVKADARLGLDQAMADQQLREAELKEAEAMFTAAVTRFKQPVHLEAALGEAQAALAKIETDLKNLPFESRRAEADYQAAQKDYDGKSASKAVVAGIEIDKAKSKMDAAKALVEELDGRLASLKNERAALIQRRDALHTQLELLADEIRAKDAAEAQVKAAKAKVAQAQVQVALAKLELNRMTIVAPIDGRVFRLVAYPGASVGNGGSPDSGDGSTIVTMYDPKSLQVRVDVRFEDVPKVRLNQTVTIDNPALKSPVTGTVLFISSQADIQKNTLQVKVAIADPPPVFKPDMLVDVTFLAPEEPAGSTEPSQEMKFYVPEPLVQSGEGGSFVWVADQSERIARKVRIETGGTGSDGLVEIKSGLTIASRVIATGLEGLRDGERIVVLGEDDSLGLAPGTAAKDRSKTLNRLPMGEGNNATH